VSLRTLNPSLPDIALPDLSVSGATTEMLNHVIQQDPLRLYDGLTRQQLLDRLKPLLTTRVSTHPIRYDYETNGDKHFPGGPAGTKFTAGKDVVNPFLQGLMGQHLGRIRRYATGRRGNQNLYLTDGPNRYTNNMDLTIQITYILGPPERIAYHGYPDASVTRHVLAPSKGGTAIPP
jgi:hypothetical protein